MILLRKMETIPMGWKPALRAGIESYGLELSAYARNRSRKRDGIEDFSATKWLIPTRSVHFRPKVRFCHEVGISAPKALIS
jgi:hypothetical protein